jgi:hypothetical protein
MFYYDKGTYFWTNNEFDLGWLIEPGFVGFLIDYYLAGFILFDA